MTCSKRWLAVLAICLAGAFLAAPASALSKAEKIRELLEITQTETIVRAIFPSMRQQMTLAISRVHPNIPDRVWDAVYAEAEATLRASVDDMIETSIPVYSRNLTDEEIDGLLAFYRSAVGQSLLTKMPQILQESVMANHQQILAAGQRVQDRMVEMLAEEGYEL